MGMTKTRVAQQNSCTRSVAALAVRQSPVVSRKDPVGMNQLILLNQLAIMRALIAYDAASDWAERARAIASLGDRITTTEAALREPCTLPQTSVSPRP